MLAFHTIPIDPNQPYQKILYGQVYDFETPIHIGSTNTGHMWLQAICSANASVETKASIIANAPWTTRESSQFGWPVISNEDMWFNTPDIPSFNLTAGVPFQYHIDNPLGAYRRIRFRVTAQKPSDAKTEFAALYIALSVR